VAQVEVTVHEADVAALANDPAMRAYLLEVGGQVAATAAGDAPRRSGAGAAAIRAELDRGDVVIGVDQLHAYMRFQDVGYQHTGTAGRYHPGRHFIDQALDRYARP
jgi:hypothetical protein